MHDEEPLEPRGLTTLTLFHFPPGQRSWAFAQMGLARSRLAHVPGLAFWRLLGSGEGGFGLRPDVARYGFLGVWRTAASADEHLAATLRSFHDRARDAWTVRMAPLASRGSWAGQNPFAVHARDVPPPDGHVGVLTRATLRFSRLRAFWRAVPAAREAIAAADGCLFSVGIGELPWVQQATFSVWRGVDEVRRFAYARDSPHHAIVRRTRSERWYAEDLFARFRVLSAEGSLEGRDPLATRP